MAEPLGEHVDTVIDLLALVGIGASFLALVTKLEWFIDIVLLNHT